MKEKKIYQDPEHKNHRQLLKNVHYNAPFIQQGFYKPMGISDTLQSIVSLTSEIYGNIAEEK
jgi:hypothetical protein